MHTLTKSTIHWIKEDGITYITPPKTTGVKAPEWIDSVKMAIKFDDRADRVLRSEHLLETNGTE